MSPYLQSETVTMPFKMNYPDFKFSSKKEVQRTYAGRKHFIYICIVASDIFLLGM